MSSIYDNWERLVAAVLKKEQLWQLFHEQSESPSISSESSSFSFLNSSPDENDVPFSFSSPKWSYSNQKQDDIATETAAPTSSTILVKDHSSSNKSTTFRKRALKIQVPKPEILQQGFFNIAPRVTSPKIPSSRVRTSGGGGHSESQANKWPDDAKQQSYPLPLPPGAVSNSLPFTRPNSAATSPSTPLRSPDSAGNLKSPGSHWKKGTLIGRGPLGDVYLGFNSEKGEMCAMKEVTLFSGDAKLKARMLEKEIALLSSLKHPNIVQYYGSDTVGDNLYIYFEYVSGGSIYTILQEYGKLGESAIRNYTQQILSGLAYLHSKRIAHRDIKGASILVDPNGRVKLSIFGIGKHIAGRYSPSLLVDTPEVIMNPNAHHLAIDIWSLGCTVLEMASSKPPTSQYAEVVAMFKIANYPRIPDYLSDEGKDFVKHCLQLDPQLRVTAFQLLEHPFVKSSSPLGRQIPVSTSSGLHQLDSERLAASSSRASKANYWPSDIYTPRNISTPVSPVSPLLYPRSPQHLNPRMSPPPKSGPHTASSSSTPLTGGISAIPFPHFNQLMILPQEISRNLPKHSPSMNSASYWDPNILRGLHADHDFQELASSDNNSILKQFRSAANGQLYELPVLADHVFQQLHRAPVKLNTSFDRNHSSPLTSHRMGGV